MEVRPKKSWQEARKVRLLQLSVSQMETFDLCHRKWALEKVRKLPVPEIAAGPFGTVTHAVIERFLRADNLGRDAAGNPVDLYPPGWTEAKNRYTGKVEGTINPAEAEVIQKLIASAQEAGVLERRPDRLIEVEFHDTLANLKCPTCTGSGHVSCPTCQGEKIIPTTLAGREVNVQCPDCTTGIIKCPTCDGDGKGDTVTLVGFIDCLTPDCVEDHKTTKNMKYAKSKNDLTKSIQMMGYAKQLLDTLRDEGRPIPDKVALRHNVYCKDPNDLRVRKTEVWVTPEDVAEFWKGMEVMAAEMSMIRSNFTGWQNVPPPSNMASACRAYGGCQFVSICAGQESEEMYAKRVGAFLGIKTENNSSEVLTQAEVNGNLQANQPVQLNKDSTMGIADRFAQRGAAANGAATSVVSPQAPSPAPQLASAQGSATGLQPPQGTGTDQTKPPPWANPACVACGGGGFDSKAAPCRICDLNAAGTKARHQSQAFEITDVGNGLMYWKFRETGVEGISPVTAVKGPVTQEVRTQAPTPVVQQAPVVTQPVQAPLVQTAPTQAPTDTGTATRTRKKKGFTLVINAAVTFGSGPSPKVTRLIEVFDVVTGELTKAAGKDYYDCDAFRRRDEVSKVADRLTDQFGTDFCVADLANATPDFKAFVEAIRPFAAMEIVGTPN